MCRLGPQMPQGRALVGRSRARGSVSAVQEASCARPFKMGRETSCCASRRSLGGSPRPDWGGLGRGESPGGRGRRSTLSRVSYRTRGAGVSPCSLLLSWGPRFFHEPPRPSFSFNLCFCVFDSSCLQRSRVLSRGGYCCPFFLSPSMRVSPAPRLCRVAGCFLGCCPGQGSLRGRKP